HHVVAPEDAEPGRHQLRDGPAVADALQDLGGDERQRLGVVELEAPGPAPAGHLGGGEDQELLLLPRGEVHPWTSLVKRTGTASLPRRRSRPASPPRRSRPSPSRRTGRRAPARTRGTARRRRWRGAPRP